jgi:hypothetical protein
MPIGPQPVINPGLSIRFPACYAACSTTDNRLVIPSAEPPDFFGIPNLVKV